MHMENGILPRAGKKEKLENPRRVAELAPAATLQRLGLADGDSVCDIGAGSGLFSLAAARMTKGDVWAVETDAAILQELAAAAAAQGLRNLHPLAADGCRYSLPDACADWVLLVTVLHEIPEREALLAELRRLLKSGGRLALIEFIRARTPMGPPPEHRLGAEEAAALFLRAGFIQKKEWTLGDNFYCQIYAVPVSMPQPV